MGECLAICRAVLTAGVGLDEADLLPARWVNRIARTICPKHGGANVPDVLGQRARGEQQVPVPADAMQFGRPEVAEELIRNGCMRGAGGVFGVPGPQQHGLLRLREAVERAGPAKHDPVVANGRHLHGGGVGGREVVGRTCLVLLAPDPRVSALGHQNAALIAVGGHGDRSVQRVAARRGEVEAAGVPRNGVGRDCTVF